MGHVRQGQAKLLAIIPAQIIHVKYLVLHVPGAVVQPPPHLLVEVAVVPVIPAKQQLLLHIMNAVHLGATLIHPVR